jgi:hypothetical protein
MQPVACAASMTIRTDRIGLKLKIQHGSEKKTEVELYRLDIA